MQVVGQTWLTLVTWTCGSWSKGQHDLYFTVHWFCLISWRLFDVWTSYFGIMSRYDTTFDLKINVGHCDLYFMVQWFCLIAWRLFDFEIMSQYDLMFDLKIFVGHCDLYFMVHLIAWRLFDLWTPYFGIVSQYLTRCLTLNICRTLWAIFHDTVILPCILNTIQWLNVILLEFESVGPDFLPQNKCRSLWPLFHGSVVVLEDYFMYVHHYLGLWLWPYAWPQSKRRSLWPIFHGPVILCCILKTIWCMYIILSEYGSVWPEVWPQNKCRSLWPIFHGLVIVPYSLKTISCMNIIIWDCESVWPYARSQNTCRSLWPIFHGPVILCLEDYLMCEHHPWGLWVSLTGHIY